MTKYAGWAGSSSNFCRSRLEGGSQEGISLVEIGYTSTVGDEA